MNFEVRIEELSFDYLQIAGAFLIKTYIIKTSIKIRRRS